MPVQSHRHSARLAEEVPSSNPLLHFAGHLDPNDPVEQEFVQELARRHREDLDLTLREEDWCV